MSLSLALRRSLVWLASLVGLAENEPLPARRARAGLLAALSLVMLLVGCDQRAATPPAAAAGSGPAADASASGSLRAVTLQLNWFPEVEHGGFFAALAGGDFRRAGLEVTIQPGGPDTPVTQLVARGTATFGVANADNILFSRTQQIPVVAVMAPLQTSPRCLIVHAAAGIRSFDDLKNMTLAMSNSQAFSFYLRKKVPLEGVRIVPYAGSVAPFLHDPQTGVQGYVFSEPFVARKEGGDPQVLMLADLGFNPYTSLLFTSEKTIRSEPELVRKMVTACVAGWRRYLEDPGPANALIHKLNPQMGDDILEFGAAAIRPLVLPRGPEGEPGQPAAAESPQQDLASVPVGEMTRERWQQLLEQIVWCGQLKAGSVDVDQAFTTKFLPTETEPTTTTPTKTTTEKQ